MPANSPTKIKILQYLTLNPQSSVINIVDHFGISKQAIHKHLLELINQKLIKKEGLPPRVFYSLNSEFKIILTDAVSSRKEVVNNFLIITPSGGKLTGYEAFSKWCNDRNYNIDQQMSIYEKTINEYSQYSMNGLINATKKMEETFVPCYADECYYGNFSAIEIFGKTGIYAQMLYAKQSGNKKNMLEIFPDIKNKIDWIIQAKGIGAVCFVAPTVNRKIQLMSELEKYLNLTLPKVKITKIQNEFTVPQKTLTKISDRQENAESTFVVERVPAVKNILLIDDFVGSGSSFNYIAKKIKQKHSCNILAFAIAGTPNGVINHDLKKFEVINEA